MRPDDLAEDVGEHRLGDRRLHGGIDPVREVHGQQVRHGLGVVGAGGQVERVDDRVLPTAKRGAAASSAATSSALNTPGTTRNSSSTNT